MIKQNHRGPFMFASRRIYKKLPSKYDTILEENENNLSNNGFITR